MKHLYRYRYVVILLCLVGLAATVVFSPSLFQQVFQTRTSRTFGLSGFQTPLDSVSFDNTPACHHFLSDPNFLKDIARVTVEKWLQENGRAITRKNAEEPFLSNQLTESNWSSVMEACHGPFPEDSDSSSMIQKYQLSAGAWMEGILKCSDEIISRGGHPSLFDGEWCYSEWRAWTNGIALAKQAKVEQVFVEAARCALHLEFPLKPVERHSYPSIRKSLPGWRPKRAVIVTLALGNTGPSRAYRLVDTAVLRDWEIVVAQGNFRGTEYKYSDALAAMQLDIESSNIAADDTLVVFADAFDVMVQQSPEYVIEAFLDQPFHFVWSAEVACFPMGSWPYSLGVPLQTCGKLFPKPHPESPTLMSMTHFANTGGWIGVASSATVLLMEMSRLVESGGPEKDCYRRGSDQLIGNTALLRYPHLLGLDTNSVFFASNGYARINVEMQKSIIEESRDPAYCYDPRYNGYLAGDVVESCPALLHFNGMGDGDTPPLPEVFDYLTGSNRSCTRGLAKVVNLETKQISQNTTCV